MAHVHADLIKKWADGAEIEILGALSVWLPVKNPRWKEDREYRIKPSRCRIRVAEYSQGARFSVRTEAEFPYVETNPAFVGWASGIIEVEDRQ